MRTNSLKIDQKIMQLIEIIDKAPGETLLDDLLVQSDLLNEDLEVILELLTAFNYQVQESNGVTVVSRIKEHNRPDYGFSPREFYFVSQLEKYEKSVCAISLILENDIQMVIHRVLFIEGKISVVGERLDTGGLEIVAISDISTIKGIDSSDYRPNYGASEVDDFLIALRKLSENEVRLVLKIRADEGVEIAPRYHFARKPYAISNMQGNKIWSASVELTDDLYAWLVSINDCVEILDPIRVKKGILKYCEESLYEEIEKQKASNG